MGTGDEVGEIRIELGRRLEFLLGDQPMALLGIVGGDDIERAVAGRQPRPAEIDPGGERAARQPCRIEKRPPTRIFRHGRHGDVGIGDGVVGIFREPHLPAVVA